MDCKEETILPTHVVKGRRTKRQRNFPTATEEEDMANCLILLAQGPPPNDIIKEKITSRELAANDKARVFLYECKTCNKCFPTFQALGGHRTSHKKPKLAVQDSKAGEIEKNLIQSSANSSFNSNNEKLARVHECLKCGLEFASGQALGGHMRRHKQESIPEHVEVRKEEKKNFMMDLDLNLPASDDDELPTSPSDAATATFSFASKPPPLLLRTSAALVDCLY